MIMKHPTRDVGFTIAFVVLALILAIASTATHARDRHLTLRNEPWVATLSVDAGAGVSAIRAAFGRERTRFGRRAEMELSHERWSIEIADGNDPPMEDPPMEDPPMEDPPMEDPPMDEPPMEDPPMEDPPMDENEEEEPPMGEGEGERQRKTSKRHAHQNVAVVNVVMGRPVRLPEGRRWWLYPFVGAGLGLRTGSETGLRAQLLAGLWLDTSAHTRIGVGMRVLAGSPEEDYAATAEFRAEIRW